MRQRLSSTRLRPFDWGLYIVIAVLVLCTVAPVLADTSAGRNLLQNPGFEERFLQYGPFKTAIVAEGWIPWWRPQSRADPVWQNRMPEYKAAAPYENRIRAGHNAQQLFTAYGTHIGGIYQTVVGIEPGSTIHFTIWGHAWAGSSDDPYRSESGGPMHMAIGIDPTGGTSAFSPRVVWSEEQNPLDVWVQFEAEAIALGHTVTVFTRSAPVYPTRHNDVYWDDSSLTVTAPAPTPTSTPKTYFRPAAATPVVTPTGDGTLLSGSHGERTASSPTSEALPTITTTSTSNSPTPIPTPTQTPAFTLSTTSSICVTAYEDRNMDREQDDNESSLSGVEFSLTKEEQVVAKIITGDTSRPTCFDPFGPGTYYLHVAAPPGYRPSSGDAWKIRLGAKDAQIHAGFRAVRHSQAAFFPSFGDDGRSESRLTMPPDLLALWTVFLVVGGVLSAIGLSTLANTWHTG